MFCCQLIHCAKSTLNYIGCWFNEEFNFKFSNRAFTPKCDLVAPNLLDLLPTDSPFCSSNLLSIPYLRGKSHLAIDIQ